MTPRGEPAPPVLIHQTSPSPKFLNSREIHACPQTKGLFLASFWSELPRFWKKSCQPLALVLKCWNISGQNVKTPNCCSEKYSQKTCPQYSMWHKQVTKWSTTYDNKKWQFGILNTALSGVTWCDLESTSDDCIYFQMAYSIYAYFLMPYRVLHNAEV